MRSNVTSPAIFLLLSACAFEEKSAPDTNGTWTDGYDEGFNSGREAGYAEAVDDFQADLDAMKAQVAALEANDTVQDGQLADLESRFIDADVTLNVPGDYTDINAALDALDGTVISSNATVTIQVADGDYAYTSAINLNHPNGNRIQIIGDTENSSAVTLRFSSGTDGFVMGNDAQLAYLGGFTLVGDGDCANANSDGIYVGANGILGLGPLAISYFGGSGLKVDGGYAEGSGDAGWFTADNNCLYGIVAWQGGQVEIPYPTLSGNSVGVAVMHGSYASTYGAYAYGNATDGMAASYGGVLVAQASTSSGNADDGFSAYLNGTIYAEGSNASGNTGAGYFSAINSTLLADNSAASNNGGAGFQSYEGSSLRAEYSNASNNAGDGFTGAYGSWMNAFGSTSTGNDIGFTAAYGSATLAAGGLADSNLKDGYASVGTSYLRAVSCSATSNGEYGFYQYTDGVIEATDCTEAGSGIDDEYIGDSSDGGVHVYR